jgi:hypothetical protein
MKQNKAQWKCPKCGHRFVSSNLWHSCGNYRLKDHFNDKAPELRMIFTKFVSVAKQSGPITVYAQKSRIVLQGRVRFAGVRVRKNWIDAHIWLKRKVEHPLLRRTESFGKLGYGCQFRLRNIGDIDQGIVQFLKEAYLAQKGVYDART